MTGNPGGEGDNGNGTNDAVVRFTEPAGVGTKGKTGAKGDASHTFGGGKTSRASGGLG